MRLPATCEQLATAVRDPLPAEGQDARVALARTRQALALANQRLAATSRCQALQRQRFGQGR